VNPALKFQINAMTLSPIPGTPQSNQVINDQPEIWAEMWNKQTELGCIPYYMFITIDTGAQHYFGVPLVRAWEIFKNA
jgi:L-lysine 2,3-aminomutase